MPLNHHGLLFGSIALLSVRPVLYQSAKPPLLTVRTTSYLRLPYQDKLIANIWELSQANNIVLPAPFVSISGFLAVNTMVRVRQLTIHYQRHALWIVFLLSLTFSPFSCSSTGHYRTIIESSNRSEALDERNEVRSIRTNALFSLCFRYLSRTFKLLGCCSIHRRENCLCCSTANHVLW